MKLDLPQELWTSTNSQSLLWSPLSFIKILSLWGVLPSQDDPKNREKDLLHIFSRFRLYVTCSIQVIDYKQ